MRRRKRGGDCCNWRNETAPENPWESRRSSQGLASSPAETAGEPVDEHDGEDDADADGQNLQGDARPVAPRRLQGGFLILGGAFLLGLSAGEFFLFDPLVNAAIAGR